MASDGKNKLPEELTDTIGQIYRKHYDNIDTDIISRVRWYYLYIIVSLLISVTGLCKNRVMSYKLKAYM